MEYFNNRIVRIEIGTQHMYIFSKKYGNYKFPKWELDNYKTTIAKIYPKYVLQELKLLFNLNTRVSVNIWNYQKLGGTYKLD